MSLFSCPEHGITHVNTPCCDKRSLWNGPANQFSASITAPSAGAEFNHVELSEVNYIGSTLRHIVKENVAPAGFGTHWATIDALGKALCALSIRRVPSGFGAGAGQPAPATFPYESYALSLELRLKAATTEFSHPRMGIVATNKHTMPITTDEAKRLLRLVNEEREDYERFAAHAGIADPEALSPDAIGFEGRMRSLVGELTRRAQAESEPAPMAAFYHCVDAINAQLTVRASAPTTEPWAVYCTRIHHVQRTYAMRKDAEAYCADINRASDVPSWVVVDRRVVGEIESAHPSSPPASPEPTQ